MGDHSSENYLDQLLNSMHGEETEHPKEQPAAKQVLRDDFEKQLFGEEETKEKAKAKKEEDCLREFEEELLKEDIPEYTESLNQKNRKKKPHRLTLPWMICSIIFHRMIFRQGMQQWKKKPVFRGKVRWKLQYHPMRMISR